MLDIIYMVIIAYFSLIIMILCHEWSHSLAAVAFGVKTNVFDITYSSHQLMFGIHEKINYDLVATLPGWQGILISFAGLMFNLVSICITLLLIATSLKTNLSSFPNLFFVVYIFAFWNICEWFNYLVIRNIFPRGDISNMIQFGFPRSVLLVLGIVVSVIFVYFLFGPAMSQLSKTLGFSSLEQKRMLYILLITFTISQVGTTYNDAFMYSRIQVGPREK